MSPGEPLAGQGQQLGQRRPVTGARGLGIGRIAGVEVRLDLSLIIIFLLITMILSAGVLPAWHPDWSPALTLVTAAAAAVAFLVSVLLHELSHAIVGRRAGMRIERITLFVFGGIAHMQDEPATWRSEFAMAIVGPITSAVIGVACLVLAGLLAGPIAVEGREPMEIVAALGPVPTLLLWLGPVNLLLAAFNLVPGFPLDGGRVLRSILWAATGDMRRATLWASRMGQLFAWILIGTGFAMILGLRVPLFGSGLIGGLWLALIGWFLNNAAILSYRQLLVSHSLRDVPVQRVMHTDYASIEPGSTVAELVESRLLQTGQRCFPVSHDGRFDGIVCLEDIRRLAAAEREETAVSQIMTPRAALQSVPGSATAAEAMQLLGEHRFNQVPVVDRDRLLGLVTRENILTWLSLTRQDAGDSPGRP